MVFFNHRTISAADSVWEVPWIRPHSRTDIFGSWYNVFKLTSLPASWHNWWQETKKCKVFKLWPCGHACKSEQPWTRFSGYTGLKQRCGYCIARLTSEATSLVRMLYVPVIVFRVTSASFESYPPLHLESSSPQAYPEIMLWGFFQAPHSLLHTSRDRLKVSLGSFNQVYKTFGVNWLLNLYRARSTWVKQDRQYTYNVTVRSVRATFVAVEKQLVAHNFSVCVCSFRYPSRKDISVPCGLPRSTIFSHIHKRHDLRGGSVTEHKMCVLVCSTTIICNISHSKKKWGRYERILRFLNRELW